MSASKITCAKCQQSDAPASLAHTFTAYDNAIVLRFVPEKICAQCADAIVKMIDNLCGARALSITVTTEDEREVSRLLAQCGIDMN